MSKRVVVIGAGCSGLAAIKCCVDEGLDVVCMEKTDNVGGLWNYTPEVREGQACVMKSTVINTSKEMMCYSDFPIPAEHANYMHNTKVWEYFLSYVEHFGLRKHIRLQTAVLSVSPAEDFNQNGQWVVKTQSTETGDVITDVYDAVMVCTGHHTEKKMPNFEGMSEFEGRVVHTHDYKDHRGLEDKRVVVVGIGNSGADVSIETSRVAKQVFLSTRRGAWVLNRVSPSGLPGDIVNTRRVAKTLLGSLPRSVRLWLLETGRQKRFNHDLFGMRPQHRLDAAHPLVCDDLANRISCGGVIIKPDIRRLTKTGVEFEDGTFEDDIDVLVCATGYNFGFPCIKHPALEVKHNRVDLFKFVFPPDIRPATLAVIGFIQPWGAIMPLSELQCRWAARVFKKETFLPEPSLMWEDVRAKQSAMAARYVESTRHTIQVDWIPYMDELAEQIGCKPDLGRLLFEDPKLAAQVYFGPCTPYQYRLQGPGRWEGARNAILTQWDRILKPFKTRPLGAKQNSLEMFYQVIMILLAIALFRWMLF